MEDNLDLHYIGLWNTVPFCENYAKLYFDAKHLKRGLNKAVGEVALWWPFFKKTAFFQKSALSGLY